jgi:hypothetical protein
MIAGALVRASGCQAAMVRAVIEVFPDDWLAAFPACVPPALAELNDVRADIYRVGVVNAAREDALAFDAQDRWNEHILQDAPRVACVLLTDEHLVGDYGVLAARCARVVCTVGAVSKPLFGALLSVPAGIFSIVLHTVVECDWKLAPAVCALSSLTHGVSAC